MSLSAFTLASVLHVIPCEYHIDTSSWPGQEAVEISARIVAANGTVFIYRGTYQPGTTAEAVREVLAYRIKEVSGYKAREVGKTLFVLESSKASTFRSITFSSEGWKPAVCWVPMLPKKK
ncbi:hypothetical protein [Frigoriglobus tundricola]|uniref:Uncharacterized protein n=1 Tax=Frigoriglobus tundricola TaxID=2774151 RepID=A0A6M5YMJ1_9BACT|nr:hypothetical protein [Frigoriglobus tundricola]QJW95148.1 hypothetical protein FTUN_2687 [Frigoriglobus tundricola]